MKRVLCFMAVALLAVSTTSAQDYNWAVGVRPAGETVGATVKYSIDGTNALEAILSTPWDNGFTITLLYERHVPVIADGFNFFYGAGGHVGAWDEDFAIGIDGIIGLEYKFPSIPLVLSADYKPIFNIAKDTKFHMADFGLGIKVPF